MSFQASASVQGRQFAGLCEQLLTTYGFSLHGRLFIAEIGVEVDCVAESPNGHDIWFEYKGSIQGSRPGLLRTDTVKKAIANGALLSMYPAAQPYVILTSHLPTTGSAAAMIAVALKGGFVHDVICINDPSTHRRLKQL